MSGMYIMSKWRAREIAICGYGGVSSGDIRDCYPDTGSAADVPEVDQKAK